MNCFVCDGEGRQITALALCKGCNIGLCREHLVEELSTPGPGGFKYGCTHTPIAHPALSRREPAATPAPAA
jgi:hypothetical protein